MKPINNLISGFPLWKRGLGGFHLSRVAGLTKAVAIKCTLLSCLLVLGLTRCATSHRERAIEKESAQATIMSGELETQFTADYLSPDRLAALEVRAQQKLIDFADYVTLIGNPTIDSTFRQQAKEQAHQLFIHPQTLVAWEEENLVLESFLHKMEQRSDNQLYIIQNIEVVQPLKQDSARQEPIRRDSAQQYSGLLTFSQLLATEGQETAYPRKVEIWVKKVDKKFGNEQKKVWEGFLGSIE